MPGSTTIDSTADRVADMEAGLEDKLADVRTEATETAASLRDAATTLREAAGPALHDAAELAREQYATARDKAGPALHDAAERARPKVESAQSSLLEDVLPKVSAAIATAAAGLSHAKEGATPYVEQARVSAHVGSERAHDALKVLTGEATITEPRGSSKLKWWLIGVGLLAAAVGAGAAFWRRQRADDPWASPLTDPPAPSLKDRAADKVADLTEAKDHTGELAEPEQVAGEVDPDWSGEASEEPPAGTGAAAERGTDEVAADDLDDATTDEGDQEEGRGV
ncbi:MAG: hypothetical protein L0H79_21320 [Intrasporangium sp.]|uniref:hypothetical protein n=1 Tax=Intrasporangium sp. TaxID=1925024 RepID=UPI0026499EC0|nr:hypothetical protein [Intrasporangium sp.]MDN5798268.1 hypothetical protein [Intrasporangium sp.]